MQLPAPFTMDSKLYFPVSKRDLYYKDENDKFVSSPTHKVLVRDDNGTQLDVCGKDYTILPNEELFPAIEFALSENVEGSILDGIKIKESLSYAGRFCMKEYIFPNLAGNVDKTDKPIVFRTIVINGYGGSAVKVITGAIDFYCTNGIVRGSFEREFKRHTSAKNLDVKTFTTAVAKSVQEYGGLIRKFKEWQDIPVNEETAKEFIDRLNLSEKLSESLLERYTLVDGPDRGDNLWGLYSTLTYYASHVGAEEGFGVRNTGADNSEAIRIDREQRVAKWMTSQAAKDIFGTTLALEPA